MGKSKRRVQRCDVCGVQRLFCKVVTSRGVRCKNWPRLCGYCALHCKMYSKKDRRKMFR